MSRAPTIPDVLERARTTVLPALEAAVASLGPELARPAAYHFGWTDADGRAVEARSGKHLRPALVLVSAEAAGGDTCIALPGAVAVELVHNFSLLHDDLIDQDRERRHRPTVWALFGVADATVGGDALLVLALQRVLQASDGEGPPAARLLLDATAEMIRGQAEDMAFEARLDVSMEECVRMAERKTGALLACASSIGALLARSTEPVRGHLAVFGRHLGLAFQAVDDLLGIWGAPEVTGKPAWSDLRQRKKSLPITVALCGAGAASEELRNLLSRQRLDEGQLARAAALVERAGGRDETTALARSRLDAALASLDDALRVGAAPPAVEQLALLARFVVEREF